VAQAVKRWRDEIWRADCFLESFKLFFQVDADAEERFVFGCSVYQGELGVPLFCLYMDRHTEKGFVFPLGLQGEKSPKSRVYNERPSDG
jgi:hypothetical protein